MNEDETRRSLRQENRLLLVQGKRRCRLCRRIKGLALHFSPNGQRHYTTVCKRCRARKRRQRWAANPIAARDQQREYRERKLLEERDPSIPLLNVPRLSDDVIDPDLDKVIARSSRYLERAQRGR